MDHYAVYHNTEAMRRSFRDDDPDSPDASFSIVTKKRTEKLVGSAIWLISGEGKPRDYRIEYWFIVAGAEPVEDDEGRFSSRVYGTAGVTVHGIALNDMPWFKAFRERHANFSIGLQRISDEHVARLCEAVAKKGFATPTRSPAVALSPFTQAAGAATRRTVVIEQRIRDSLIVAEVKRRHDFSCQVCGVRLETPDGPYAECAHIRPLGSPHDGPDTIHNVLCLCPNDHVLFDTGAYSIRDDMVLLGRKGVLRVIEGHQIHREHLSYHRKLFRFKC